MVKYASEVRLAVPLFCALAFLGRDLPLFFLRGLPSWAGSVSHLSSGR